MLLLLLLCILLLLLLQVPGSREESTTEVEELEEWEEEEEEEEKEEEARHVRFGYQDDLSRLQQELEQEKEKMADCKVCSLLYIDSSINLYIFLSINL